MKNGIKILTGGLIFLIIATAILVRVGNVSDTCKGVYAPTNIPFVWQFKEEEAPSSDWKLPKDIFKGVDNNLLMSVGSAYFKNFDEVDAEVGYPEEYLEFDDSQTVKLLFIPFSFTNRGNESVLMDVTVFEVYAGLIPQTYASWLTDLYEDRDFYVNPGETRETLAVYRVRRDGLSDEQWENVEKGPLYLTSFAGGTKYRMLLPLENEK